MIEEDLSVTGMGIIPRKLITALKEFGEEKFDKMSNDESLLTGKLLKWRICMEILNAAAIRWKYP